MTRTVNGFVIYAEDKFGSTWHTHVNDLSEHVHVHDLLSTDGVQIEATLSLAELALAASKHSLRYKIQPISTNITFL